MRGGTAAGGGSMKTNDLLSLARTQTKGMKVKDMKEAFQALTQAVCDCLIKGQAVKFGKVGTIHPALTRGGKPKLNISASRKLLARRDGAPRRPARRMDLEPFIYCVSNHSPPR